VDIGVAELLGNERDDLLVVDGLEPVHPLGLGWVDEHDAGGRGRRRRGLGRRLGRGGGDDAESSARRRGGQEQAAAGGGGRSGCGDGEGRAQGGQGHSRGCHWSGVRGGGRSRARRARLMPWMRKTVAG